MASQLQLLAPDHAHLDAYAAALRTGWSPYTTHDVSAEHLAAIKADADAFLVDLVRMDGVVGQPDGTTRAKLPQIIRWMWDGEFAGAINLRWQPGSNELPPYVSGHVGYTVVPWKRRKGYATEALRMMLDEAKSVGLGSVEITTDPSNIASQAVIKRCGGIHVATCDNPFTGLPKLHYRIDLVS
ncbi:MAG: GNAT family N-acetyltransferase [Hyphomicrobiales bacterium]|nr:GNAT family N-acetyltransferase [Hyphomicrobiales bacterium]